MPLFFIWLTTSSTQLCQLRKVRIVLQNRLSIPCFKILHPEPACDVKQKPCCPLDNLRCISRAVRQNLGGYHFLWNRRVINIRKYPGNIFETPPISQKNFYDPPYPGANIFATPPSPWKQIGASFNDWLWTTSYAGWTTLISVVTLSVHMYVSCQHQR